MTTTAACHTSGSESASGSMTNELRVPRLKTRVRPTVGVSLNNPLSTLPMMAGGNQVKYEDQERRPEQGAIVDYQG